MGMSDCQKCWETPCSCGWEYKDYSPDQLSKFIADITNYRSKEDALKIIGEATDIINSRLNKDRV